MANSPRAGNALHLLTKQTAAAVHVQPEALYPGGSYPTFMAQWKQQLEHNSCRRRCRQLLEDLHRRLAKTASGSGGGAHDEAVRAAAAAAAGVCLANVCAADLEGSDGHNGLSEGYNLDQASLLTGSMLSATEGAVGGGTNGTRDDGTDSVFRMSGGRVPHGRKLAQSLLWQKVLYNNGEGVNVDGKYTGLWAYADIQAFMERDSFRSVKVRHGRKLLPLRIRCIRYDLRQLPGDKWLRLPAAGLLIPDHRTFCLTHRADSLFLKRCTHPLLSFFVLRYTTMLPT